MINKVLLILILTALSLSALYASPLTKGNYELNEAVLSISQEDEKIPVFILLREQYDTEKLYREVRGLDKPERRTTVINKLISFSEQTQDNLRNTIERLETENQVDNVRYYWIVNMIAMDASLEALTELDHYNEIDVIAYDPFEQVIFPVDDDNTPVRRNDEDRQQNNQTRFTTPSVTRIRAPQVWAQGYMGVGIVVAILDTGVDYRHRDIVNRMWQHNDYPYHGYNFVSNNNNPNDVNGHGTHCAGIVAGDGTGGTITGVAPASEIMAVKVLADNGSAQLATSMSGIQFAVQNGAHVINMSYGWRNATAQIKNSFRTAMINTLSAGVVATAAVGNFGRQQAQYPPPNNVGTPGSCPAPWLHPDQTTTGGLSAVISVGATDNNDLIANFSSRGHVIWSNVAPFNDYGYNPGIGLIVPDIVAPGVNVNSLRNNSNNYVTNSGTSMAAPAVAGVIALMISKDIGITPEEISQIIEETAVSLSESKSNTFGSGRIDALNAVGAVVGTSPPNPAVRPSPVNGSEFVGRRPRLEWFNGGGARAYNVYLGTDNPPTNTVNGTNTEESYYQVTTDLESQRTYYWRIDSINDIGVRTGNVWTFETGAPNAVSSPEPANQATDIRTLPLLRWIDEGGAESFNVYFGTDNPPTNILNGEETNEASYQITEDLETETLHYWRIDAINGNGVTAGEVWSFTTGLPAGEGFETGDFSANHWQLYYTGNMEAYWYVDDEESYSGQYSARTGYIRSNGTTTLAITIESYEPGSISFARKVSAAIDAHFDFTINNELIARWSGEVEWDEVTIPVPVGENTYRWTYYKTGAAYGGSNAAWIDHITFPEMVVPPTLPSPPVDISSAAKLGHINVRWSLPQERPVILGYNIYRSAGTNDSFHRINEELHRSNNFQDEIVAADSFYYYVTAVFENGESEPSEQTFITINEPVVPPSLSHEAGEYNEPVYLTLDAEDDEIVIYYTIDGSEPTENSILYEEAIHLDLSTTIKARSFKLGHVPSETLEAEYIISLSAEQEYAGHNARGLFVYPNPGFIGSRGNMVNIAFALAGNKDVNVRIYNIKGQLVRDLGSYRNDGEMKTLTWDLSDNKGRVVGTGVYLINLQTPNERITKRMMLVH